ncbi:hypothetical protein ES703_87872 [subsurface metagenome]
MTAGFLPITINHLTNQPFNHLTNQSILTIYAKQTQFSGCPNERNLFLYSGL